MTKPKDKKSYTSPSLTNLQMDIENPVLTTSPGTEDGKEEEEEATPPKIGNFYNYDDAEDTQY